MIEVFKTFAGWLADIFGAMADIEFDNVNFLVVVFSGLVISALARFFFKGGGHE